ncbi:lipopolysaccharide biosynthesis protein [Streptomyces sp. NBC_01795]|uniref:lipopolysaccharide biosynthesis protein n=1 Tax=Streptomyces sp. NBC_01795 TaxID=2975943 RepID=UPI002DDC8B65|nr:lipopolysaccharide biosynthesis protein [Streptomyces sp. NBC_01795]WSA90346.1 lipopolysaccharide biosynthesis protein [Streptomyces sp. NBC_01795]
MSTEPTEPAPPDGAAPGRLARLRARLAPSRAGRTRTRRRSLPAWWPVALCLLLGTGAGAGYGLLKAPQYTATSYVVVVPTAHTDPATALGFAQAYGRVAAGGAVLREARPAAGLPLSTLQSAVRSATSPDAPMIEISATAARPGRAAVVANAVSRALTRHGNHSAERTTVRLLSFARATPPAGPTSPSLPVAAAVGGCAGGLLGGLIRLIRPRPGHRADLPGVPGPAAAPGTPAPAADRPSPAQDRPAAAASPAAR